MDSSASQKWQPKHTSNRIAGSADEQLRPLTDLQNYAQRYMEQQPEMAAMICLGIGFVLGWKLKPW